MYCLVSVLILNILSILIVDCEVEWEELVPECTDLKICKQPSTATIIVEPQYGGKPCPPLTKTESCAKEECPGL